MAEDHVTLETDVAVLKNEVKHLQRYVADRDQQLLGMIQGIDDKHSRRWKLFDDWKLLVDTNVANLCKAQNTQKMFVLAWVTLAMGASWLIAQIIAVKGFFKGFGQ